MAEREIKNVYRVPYHWTLHYFFNQKYEYPLRLLEPYLRGDEVALDVGCGDGRLMSLLAGRIGRIVGLDHQLLPLRFARLLISQANVSLLQHDVLLAPLPFAANSFDLVTAFDVIEHIPLEAVPALLSECQRVLKPGGKLVLTTPNRDNLRNRIWGHRLPGKHYFELNSREASEMLGRAGFEVMALRGIYLPIPIPKIEHYASIFPFRALFRRLIALGGRFTRLSETLFVVAHLE